MPFAIERSAELRRFICFAIVGSIVTAVDFALFYMLAVRLSAPPAIAHLAAFLIATICSYVLNRSWTFWSVRAPPASAGQFYRFIALGLVAATLSTVALQMLIHLEVPLLLAKVLATGVSMVSNYLFMSRIVFVVGVSTNETKPS